MDIKKELEEIYKMLNDDVYLEDACIKFFELVKRIEDEDVNCKELPHLYNELGIVLFNNYFYEDSIKMLSKAYEQGFNKKQIKNFIYESFINPNKEEFKENFSLNLNLYKKKNQRIIFDNIKYNELQLDFIPVSEERYYIFDLQKDKFDTVIDISEEELQKYKQFTHSDEFSDILLLDEYDVNSIKPYLNRDKKRKLYYLINEPLKTYSFFKIPHIVNKIFNNVTIFSGENHLKSFFRKNLDIYIPHIVLNSGKINQIDYIEKINDILEDEHKFRLTSDGRCDENVLISICYPSFNRGKRCLQEIEWLLKCKYDSEIEFVVFDNNSIRQSYEYEKISKIKDSRLSYYKSEEKPGIAPSISLAIKHAKGKFVMLMSDEDKVYTEALQHYLNILKNNSQISVIRSSTHKVYNKLTDNYYKAGNEAFINYFLTNNYMTGIIYNRNIIMKNDFIDKMLYELHTNNNKVILFYQHMWLDCFMSYEGDVIQDSTMLCIEGEDERENQEQDQKKSNINIFSPIKKIENLNISKHQTYESRIEQHYSFIELLNKLPIDDDFIKVKAYLKLCWKTYMLFSLVERKYRDVGKNINEIYDIIENECLKGLKLLEFHDNDSSTKDYYMNQMITNIKNYRDEFNKI